MRQLPLRVFPEAPGIDVSTVAVVKRLDKAGDGRHRRGSVPDRADADRAEPGGRRSRRPPTPKISAFVVLYPDKAIDRSAEPDHRVRAGVDDRRAIVADPRRARCGWTHHLRGDVPGRRLRAGHLRAARDRAAGRIAGRDADDVHDRAVDAARLPMAMRTGLSRGRSLVLAALLSSVVGDGAGAAAGGATVDSACRVRARVQGRHDRRSSSTSSSAIRADDRSGICRPDEITVLEDGVAREVRAFRLVEGGTARRRARRRGTRRATNGSRRNRIRRAASRWSRWSSTISARTRDKLAAKAALDYLRSPLPADAPGRGVLARPAPAHAAGTSPATSRLCPQRSLAPRRRCSRKTRRCCPARAASGPATLTSPRPATRS